jgi:hypothetical protein
VALFRPGKPWYSRHVGTLYVPGTGSHLVVFDDDAGDGDWPSVSGTSLVVGLSGLYLLLGTLGVHRTGNGALQLTLLVNSADVALGATNAPPDTTVAVHRAMQLDAGDTIELSYSSIGASPAHVGTATRLDVVRIGPVRWT